MSNQKNSAAPVEAAPAIVAETINTTVAAVAAIKGVATVVGFHYIKGLCSISLSNGVSGIVGDAATFPFGVMLTLKGTHAAVRYSYLKDKTINDKVYRTYALEWSLE